MGDISAIIITLFLCLILIFSEKLKKNRSSYKIIILGFLAHLIIALYNGFVGPSIGAGFDAISFISDAEALALSGNIQFKLGSDSYRNILGGLFYLFGSSMFLACMLSVTAYVASLFPLIEICKALKLRNIQTHIIAAYSFLPSMVLFGSVALREAMQVCFFMFAISYFIQFYSHRKIRFFIIAVFFSFLMGILHFGLLLFAGGMTTLFILMNYNQSNKSFVYTKSKFYTYLLLAIMIGTIITFLPSLDQFGVVSIILQGENIAEFTEQYREGGIVLNARSAYDLQIDYSSIFNLFTSLFMILFYYIAYPFPWKVSAIIDIYACLEAMWRCLLIYYSFKGLSQASGDVKKIITILIILYFSLALIWASGTNNFGNGMRHNLTHYWILTITGLPYLILSLRKFINSLFYSKATNL
jgi:hypothetical protein